LTKACNLFRFLSGVLKTNLLISRYLDKELDTGK